MGKAWTVLAGGDLWKVVSREVVMKADEDSAGGTHADGNFDAELDSRAKSAVAYAVGEVRGAIESAGMMPLSVTPDAVPPELREPTLAAAAYRLCLTKPSLLAVVMNDGGVFAPVVKLYEEFKKQVEALRRGANLTPPTDPTGRDYINAVSSENRAISRVFWSDNVGDDQEYADGQTSSGQIVNGGMNDMNTY